ncbi:hypothetical protein BC567DRAFT_221131 [Phyllosticta citribraziliensis]
MLGMLGFPNHPLDPPLSPALFFSFVLFFCCWSSFQTVGPPPRPPPPPVAQPTCLAVRPYTPRPSVHARHAPAAPSDWLRVDGLVARQRIFYAAHWVGASRGRHAWASSARALLGGASSWPCCARGSRTLGCGCGAALGDCASQDMAVWCFAAACSGCRLGDDDDDGGGGEW